MASAREIESCGYVVHAATTSQGAWEIVSNHCLDIVLLDGDLPGEDLLGRIRSREEYETLFVVLLIPRATDTDVFEGYRRGADIVLKKTVSFEEIRSIFRQFP